MQEGIHVVLAAEKLGTFLGIPITNALVMSWVVIGILVAIAFIVRSRLALIPGRFQVLLEETFTFVFDYVAEVLESKELARRFFPLLMTIFLFLLVGNELEFTPGIGSVLFSQGHEYVPFLRTPASDLNVPLALALISFFVIQITGFTTPGVMVYLRKFFTLSSPIAFGVGVVEFIGEFARIISLAFRLFGNILAGEVIVLVAMYFAPYLGPVPLIAFELFVGFLQAAIFALLTLFFIKLAVTPVAEH